MTQQGLCLCLELLCLELMLETEPQGTSKLLGLTVEH